MIALNTGGILATCALAGLGLFTATLQLEARNHVAVVDKAVQDYTIADALFDDVRTGVQREVLLAFGASHQIEISWRHELRSRLLELGERLAENAEAPLPAALRQNYIQLQRKLIDFAQGAKGVFKLPAETLTTTYLFDLFHSASLSTDELMDIMRNKLHDHAIRVRDPAAAVFQQVRWMIIGSLVIGIGLLFSITWGAVVIGRKIIGALASSQQATHHLACHYPLIGLPDGAFLAERLEKSLAEANRTEKLLALRYFDLDHFKQVNDTPGHPVGGELLRAVAERLCNCVQKSETLTRHGGDESVIMQTPISCARSRRRLKRHKRFPHGSKRGVVGDLGVATIGIALEHSG